VIAAKQFTGGADRKEESAGRTREVVAS